MNLPHRARHAAHRGATRKAGFTVPELMMVMVVLGLMAYTVSMSYEALVPGQRLNSSVRGLAGTLQATRSDAIARNAEFWVEYQLDEERYRIVTPFRLGGGRTIGEQEEDTERFVLPWQALEKGVELHSVAIAGELYQTESVYVRFDPLGAASDHTVTLVQRGQDYENFFTVEVLALTGLIRFHDGIYTREPPDEKDFE